MPVDLMKDLEKGREQRRAGVCRRDRAEVSDFCLKARLWCQKTW